MEYVIGWMTTKPGHRAVFLQLSAPFIAKTRAEPGVLFFELLPGSEPDVALAVEGYASPKAHKDHVQSDHFAEFWGLFKEHVVSGHFENVVASSVRTDSV